MQGPIEFRARWREELEAITSEGKLVFELTMGTLHVYFPDEPRWVEIAPAWARTQWKRYVDECRRWCAANGSGFTLTGDAHFSEERSPG